MEDIPHQEPRFGMRGKTQRPAAVSRLIEAGQETQVSIGRSSTAAGSSTNSSPTLRRFLGKKISRPSPKMAKEFF